MESESCLKQIFYLGGSFYTPPAPTAVTSYRYSSISKRCLCQRYSEGNRHHTMMLGAQLSLVPSEAIPGILKSKPLYEVKHGEPNDVIDIGVIEDIEAEESNWDPEDKGRQARMTTPVKSG
ncbi:hypothetical protein H4Q26_017657 [Puccinia striiformis f. sp. tritici PST-130]|nr:hypothetical protein H4Q26_017657 [Puccinia striiformis f. sp. tritici PST-130]